MDRWPPDSYFRLSFPAPIHALALVRVPLSPSGAPVEHVVCASGLGWPWASKAFVYSCVGLRGDHLLAPRMFLCSTADGAAGRVVRWSAATGDFATVCQGPYGEGGAEWVDVTGRTHFDPPPLDPPPLRPVTGVPTGDAMVDAEAKDAIDGGGETDKEVPSRASSDESRRPRRTRRVVSFSSSSSSSSDSDSSRSATPPAPSRYLGPCSLRLRDVNDAHHASDGGVWWNVGVTSRVVTRSEVTELPSLDQAACDDDDDDEKASSPNDDGTKVPTFTGAERTPQAWVAGDVARVAHWLLPEGKWCFAADIGMSVRHSAIADALGAAGGAVAVRMDSARAALLDPRCRIPVGCVLPVIADTVDRHVRSPTCAAVLPNHLVATASWGGHLMLFDLRMEGARRPLYVHTFNACGAGGKVRAGTNVVSSCCFAASPAGVAAVAAQGQRVEALWLSLNGIAKPLEEPYLMDHGVAVTAVSASMGGTDGTRVSVLSADASGDLLLHQHQFRPPRV
jgi:hypothetical protein